MRAPQQEEGQRGPLVLISTRQHCPDCAVQYRGPAQATMLPPRPARPSPSIVGTSAEENGEVLAVAAANSRAVPPDTIGKVTELEHSSLLQ